MFYDDQNREEKKISGLFYPSVHSFDLYIITLGRWECSCYLGSEMTVTVMDVGVL